MPDKILEVKDLNVSFDQTQVLNGVNFGVNRGDVMAIIGPNGAGKSVLFRALLNLIPYSGDINWTKGTKISYIPQKFHVDRDFPLNVGEFLSYKERSREKKIAMLKSVGLGEEQHIEAHILKQRLGWLSGGELQRVLVAWSLLDNPSVLMFDEPTTGIDIGGEETIYNLLKKMQGEHGLTLIMISHDLNIIYKYANSVVCLNKQMICFGIPHEVLDPEALTKLYGGDVSFYKHEHEKN